MSDRSKFSSFLSDPSLLLAVPATCLYYGIMFHPAMRGGILHQYTTAHAVEYVIVAMFMWAMADVVLKLLSFPRELWALRQTWLPARVSRVPVSQAITLLDAVRLQPARLLQSRLGQRLVHALTFVVENKSAEEFPEHLRYLADQDHEATHNRYALISFVVAVSPILGFLGTVVHFGTALTGMTIQNMDKQLPHVVSEMGTAFNTTTVAIGAAMITMFSKFLCERMERGINGRIDRLVERELMNRFEVKSANIAPLAAILESANREFHSAVQQSLQQQVMYWSQALQAMFEQFDKRQKQEEQRWQAMCLDLQERIQKRETAHEDQLKQILKISDDRQEKNLLQVQAVLKQASQFSGEVGALAKTLNSIAHGEGKLAELQGTLNENLRVLHQTSQIDEALHGLTAAIHLLTVRHQGGQHNRAA